MFVNKRLRFRNELNQTERSVKNETNTAALSSVVTTFTKCNRYSTLGECQKHICLPDLIMFKVRKNGLVIFSQRKTCSA